MAVEPSLHFRHQNGKDDIKENFSENNIEKIFTEDETGERINEEEDSENEKEHRIKIVWFNIFLYGYFHLVALYGIYLCFTSAMFKTIIFSCFYLVLGNIGITAGSHRLWSHRSYKAKWPLRALLCVFTSIAGQNSIYEWCRDHRVHHKFTETNADPHSIRRGFFFAHMGWLLCKKHPAVLEKGKNLNFDDLMSDSVVRFHRKYYLPMMLCFCFFLPTLIPVWFWGESWWNSFFVAALTRYCVSLHITWLVNSAAHYIGNQPFDKYMDARENPLVSLFAVGEGWHNYHHTFPWDYSTSELGYTLNVTKIFIDIMAFLGLAYDMKTATSEMILSRKLKSGDGSRL